MFRLAKGFLPALCILASAGHMGHTVRAQGPAEVKLAQPIASWSKPLSSIRGLRELPDGRILVADGIDEVLLRVDLARGRADTIGRAGAGPGEYKTPDGLFPMPDGGTLLVDLGNGRLSHFGADGKYKDSWSIARGGPGGPGGLLMILPTGVDAQGRIYFESRGGGPGDGRPDSAVVLRWDRASDKIDTIARRKLPGVTVTTSGGSNNRNVMMRPQPLTAEDGWTVTSDGRVALVRAGNYSVEWVTNGRYLRGPANTYRPVRITAADKEAWIAQSGDGVSVMVEANNGQVSARFGRGRGGRPAPNPNDLEWPESKPPFAGVSASPNGEAWVQRNVSAGQPLVFDVFGADGRLVRRVTLPAGRRLEGFGKAALYLSRADDSDLRYIEKYAMPK